MHFSNWSQLFDFIWKIWRFSLYSVWLYHVSCIYPTDTKSFILLQKSDGNQTIVKPFHVYPTDRKFPALFENLEYINVTNMWYGYQICQMHFLNCCKVFTLIQKLRQWKYLIHMVCLPDYVRCMSPTVSKSSTYMKT